MSFRFNMLLKDAGLNPGDVRLLRHQADLPGRRSLFDWWHQDRAAFEGYQSLQLQSKRASFARPYWAAFLGTWDGRTMFAGIYEVGSASLLDHDIEAPISGDGAVRPNAPAGNEERVGGSNASPEEARQSVSLL